MHWLQKKWAFGVLGLGLLSAGVLLTERAYAAAGACGNCRITSVGVTNTGFMIVSTSLHMNGPCSNPTWMVFDTSTTKGKALMSLVTGAYLSGASVDMAGTNTCSTTATGGMVAEYLNNIVIR
jgi:hypothetical protein